MFYNNDFLNNMAKQLAFLANNRVSVIADTVSGNRDSEQEVTGAVIAVVPHLIEKAIVTHSTLPGDVSAVLCARFLKEYEALLKMVSNAGGFSNPVKKALFNASFHTMFSREYAMLNPKFNALWEKGREEQQDPIDLAAYGLVKYCESSSGLDLDNVEIIEASCIAVQRLFSDVHEILRQ